MSARSYSRKIWVMCFALAAYTRAMAQTTNIGPGEFFGSVQLESLSPNSKFNVLPDTSIISYYGIGIEGSNARSWFLSNNGTVSGRAAGVSLKGPVNTFINNGSVGGNEGTAIFMGGGNNTLTLGATSDISGDVAGTGNLALNSSGFVYGAFSGFSLISLTGTLRAGRDNLLSGSAFQPKCSIKPLRRRSAVNESLLRPELVLPPITSSSHSATAIRRNVGR